MNHQRARALIERYFAGETSLAEERELRAYFGSDHVDPELRKYVPLFGYWKRERSITASHPKRSPRRLPQLLLAVAAALLLLVVVRNIRPAPTVTAFPVAERQPVDWSRYEVTDEREALRILRGVLKTTAEKMQQGPAITLRELREVEDILD
ncbi:hypothetical protein [Lewinella sp. JB7]|uniref:hypothetical protein n=1 Tax=Lewinella sp. JB7 TaxID=2962887 RepID=UPI0020C9ECF2|nr:hypothetical protein [Lewinella sp. JB7]MCP9236900.1 hypothetical protein [Lewinella sp. JB7]